MGEKYYIAEKGCSRGVDERVMLAVDEEGNIRFHRGGVEDRFEINPEGRPVCTTWNGLSLPYVIGGPLTDEQLENWTSLGSIYWSGSSRRILSARRVF